MNWWSLALLVVLSGCGNPLPTHIYSLPGESASHCARHASASVPGALIVTPFAADSVLSQRGIAWRSGPKAFRVGNYSNDRWNTSPPELLQQQIVQCLSDSGAAEFVTRDDVPVASDWILTGGLVHFEQQLMGPDGTSGNAQARVAADLVLIHVGANNKPIWHERIDVAVPLADDAPASTRDGIERALQQFCCRLLQKMNEALPVRVGAASHRH